MSLTSGTLAKIALGEELVGHFEDPVFQVNTVGSTYRILPYMFESPPHRQTIHSLRYMT